MRRWLLVALIGVFCLLCGCGDAVQQPATDHLKVSYLPFIGYTPLFIAQEEGYFQEHGMKVDLERMTSTEGALAGLISGEIDVVGAFVQTGVFNAIDRGAPLRIVASRKIVGPPECDHTGVLMRSELIEQGVPERPEELRGLTVSIRKGTVEEYFFERLFGRKGITLSDVEVTTVAHNAKAGAFAADTLDLAYSAEPQITLMRRQGTAQLWASIEDISPGFEAMFLLYGPRLLEKERDLGVRFLSAYLQGARHWNQGRDPRSVEILRSYTNIDPEVVHDMCWFQFSPDGALAAETMLGFQEWAVDRGYQERIVPVAEFFDPSFIEGVAVGRLDP